LLSEGRKSNRQLTATTSALYPPSVCAYKLGGQMVQAAPHLAERLRTVGLRLTRPRLALARLLFDGEDRHTTAEQLRAEAAAASIRVSLATVYNVLHQFTAAGLLREVVVETGRSYFDTNIDDHHHFFCEASGALQDIAGQDVTISGLPVPPAGTEISRVEVIVRVRARDG
jgi:Fur family iron response transcriptional regulator